MPFYELLKKDREFGWTEKCQKALDTLKARLMNNVMLAYPCMDQPFYIYTDASHDAVGSGTYQKDLQGHLRPVSLLSVKFTPIQQRYSSNEKEVLAVISAIKYHKEMITTETPIYLYSSNLTTVFFMSLGEKTERLFRYSLFHSKYNIQAKHISQRNQLLADALSRPPADQECPTLEPEVLDDVTGGKHICGMEVEPGDLRWLTRQLPETYSPGHVDHLLQRPPTGK